MHYLISIVGMVLTSKKNYREWYKNIKITMIFNDLWNGIYEVAPSNEEEDKSKSKSKSSRATIPTVKLMLILRGG
jgi:hypothetical protein